MAESSKTDPDNSQRRDSERIADDLAARQGNTPFGPTDASSPGDVLEESTTRIGRYMLFGFFIMTMAAGTWVIDRWLTERARAKPPIVFMEASGRPAVSIEADSRGHYRVQALINGQPADFLIDTGATQVAIPETLARELGLQRGQPEMVITANGTAIAFSTQIDQLQLGPLSLGDVDGLISPSMEGRVGLLGMSFLRYFELLQQQDRLTIREPG